MVDSSPTREQWEEKKHLVLSLYIGQNSTAKEVVAHLKRNHGWNISTRQLKSRLQDWNASGHKRTRAPYYLAMMTVANHHYNKDRLRTTFQVPKRYTKEVIDFSKIQKEVNRIEGGYDKLPPLTAAKQMLLNAGYTWETPSCRTIRGRERRYSSDSDSVHHRRQFSAVERAIPPIDPNQGLKVVHSPSQMHEDFAFADILHQGTTPASSNCGDRVRVGSWAGPFCWQAFDPNRNADDLRVHKAAAMEHFRSMLMHNFDNQYIFPCLSWMILVLGSHMKTAELQEFLSSSCQVIVDKDPKGLTYRVPFCYTLAVQTGDRQGKEEYGNQLEQCHDQIRLVWGSAHPNTLVVKSIYAWDLLEASQYLRAIEVLEPELQTFEYVMGADDQLTISCQAILARAYQMRGQLERAIELLTQAIKSLGDFRTEFKPTSYRLHLRLGTLLAQTGKLSEAERYLWKAVNGRIDVFGLGEAKTWSAIDELCKLLQQTGRTEELNRWLQVWGRHPECSRRDLADLSLRISHRAREGLNQNQNPTRRPSETMIHRLGRVNCSPTDQALAKFQLPPWKRVL
ncbi:hypothetical protein, variant [Exophiala mesophila]|uniref:Clr5 domain-containing protein n=1 Tax=Exophiala mesophila TaxID=212818 RepID=A0A0D1WKY7_EXOME|nr:uncharacterized protein PV10_07035 [Exophiala mesophila]XP_016221224.1 hypothetical protein, variant [Exophiala mesophila]KIV89649.1 hypothetical protein PV10_07035 [Exophiala mesophila]KIV89650.1 hypothetical protein, variant [Exophiala mesophila]